MILHIFPVGMFTKDYLNFIQDYFDPAEHCFVKPINSNKAMNSIYDTKIFENYPNCVDLLSLDFVKKLLSAKGILVHGMFGLKQPLLFTLLPFLRKKSNWLIWGGDLYCNRNKKASFKQLLANQLKKHSVKKFKFITTLNKKDFEYAQKWYHVTGENLLATYPVKSMVSLPNAEIRSRAQNEAVKIIIGNSATITNQHKEALSMLEKFKDKNIEIYLPLSYGFGDYLSYGKAVTEYAKNIFGNKVHPIYNCLKAEEYTKLLQQMDIGIYNNNRQQAMGNIQQMVWFGKKVYMRTDTSMWENCRDDRGFLLNDINQIEQETFEEFITYDSKVQQHNMQKAREYHSIERYLKVWSYIFDRMNNNK